jgi:hypothetical protein
MRGAFVTLIAALLVVLPCSSGAPGGSAKSNPKHSVEKKNNEDLAFEGEKRFRANCERCHQAPHKFPAAVMGTVIRHMRVRATITDEDMRQILNYMTR